MVDDHWLARTALVQILASLCPEAAISEASDYLELLAVMAVAPPELLLLDLAMPGLADWRSDVPKLIAGMHRTCVVVVSALEDRAFLQRLFEAGVAGFVPKQYDGQKLIDALRVVIRGGVHVPLSAVTDPVGAPISARERMREVAQLTPRQKDVMALIGEGLPNRVIASRLQVSEATVKTHTNAIFRTLGVSNRTEVALLARQFGFGGTLLLPTHGPC